MRQIRQSRKLHHVRYDVRGPILVEAQRLEAEGHRILKLNIGNPAPFGFEAPEAIVADMVHHLPDAQGYSDSQGIYPARTAVAQYYQQRGLRDVNVDDVYIGNGVSELISMVLQAFVDDGNEILVPAPDYPLWTGAVTLSGGTPVHYLCDEASGWEPDLADIESKITENTHAIVIINPNNPTGAVYRREVVAGLINECEIWIISRDTHAYPVHVVYLLSEHSGKCRCRYWWYNEAEFHPFTTCLGVCARQ
jgi:alanine-synthesizing transaminase